MFHGTAQAALFVTFSDNEKLLGFVRQDTKIHLGNAKTTIVRYVTAIGHLCCPRSALGNGNHVAVPMPL